MKAEVRKVLAQVPPCNIAPWPYDDTIIYARFGPYDDPKYEPVFDSFVWDELLPSGIMLRRACWIGLLGNFGL